MQTCDVFHCPSQRQGVTCYGRVSHVCPENSMSDMGPKTATWIWINSLDQSKSWFNPGPAPSHSPLSTVFRPWTSPSPRAVTHRIQEVSKSLLTQEVSATLITEILCLATWQSMSVQGEIMEAKCSQPFKAHWKWSVASLEVVACCCYCKKMQKGTKTRQL